MNVVIRVSDKDRARAWGFLVRHSPGTALPNSTFVITEVDARGLRGAGIDFTEISRERVSVTEGITARERI